MFTGEPLIIIGAVDAALIAGQQAINMSNLAHGITAAVIAGLGYIIGRSQVSPSP